MYRRVLLRASLIGAICFVPLYVHLWCRYPHKYFSEYILTDHRVLGYALYFLVMAEVVMYGLTKAAQKRPFLSAASFLTALFIFWIMVYPPSSSDHFEYFMYTLAFAVGILAVDLFGGHLLSFIDSKEAAMSVILLAPVVILFIIVISAASAAIEKAVIGMFLAALVVRTVSPDRGSRRGK